MMLDDILIVLVVYEKNLKETVFYQSLILALPSLDFFIYDNSKSSQIKDICLPNLFYVHDISNPGVSKAYNEAAKYATLRNKKAILLLDQDSGFSAENIIEYLEKYRTYGDDFIYAPLVVDAKKSKVYSPANLKHFVGHAVSYPAVKRDGLFCLKGMSVINSGLLIPLAIFDTIGGFNEKIKLDFSDVYFVERYKEFNQNIILLDIEMTHGLSGDEGKNFFKETSRFAYYCTGARELSNSLRVSTLWSVLRRMARLVIKYGSVRPVITFLTYYVLGALK